jgi:hypothetical protein
VYGCIYNEVILPVEDTGISDYSADSLPPLTAVLHHDSLLYAGTTPQFHTASSIYFTDNIIQVFMRYFYLDMLIILIKRAPS